MSHRWDQYYHSICVEVGKNSKCLSRQIGAILVQDKTIVCTGYNGPPRGVPHCGERYYLDSNLRDALKQKGLDPDNDNISYHSICPRYILGFKSGEGLEWCIAGHSERNCLTQSGREGIKTKGSILYMDCGIPCTPCFVEIINAGVEEIVITEKSYYNNNISTPYLIQNSNLKVRIFKHLCKHENPPLNTICKDCGDYITKKGKGDGTKNL